MRSFSSHFDGEPFFRNPPGWMEDDWRTSREESPMESTGRHSPSQQEHASMNGTRSGSASPGMKSTGNPFFTSRFHHDPMPNGMPGRGKHENRSDSRSSTPASAASSSEHDCPESPAPPPNVEKHSGVKSKVHQNSTKIPQTAKRQPKVHHIPIHVEPRDGNPNQQQPQQQPQQQQQQQERSTATLRVSPPRQQENSASASASPQPPRRQEQNSSPGKQTSKSTVHIIPVQVTHSPPPNETQRQSSPIPLPSQVDSCPPQPQMPPAAPTPAPAPAPAPGPSTVKPTQPLEVIEMTLRDLERLKDRVEKFSGTRSDKEYLYLDEMLTRNLIKLDNIVVEGNPEMRQARKAAIKEVNGWVHILESHVIGATGGQMEADAAPLAETEAMETSPEDGEKRVDEEAANKEIDTAAVDGNSDDVVSSTVVTETGDESAANNKETKTYTTSVNVQISDSTQENDVTDH